MSTAELRLWLHAPEPGRFPYAAVVRAFHDAGKHFVSPELLELLSAARDTLPGQNDPRGQPRTLAAFLNTALDKADNRYDYPTYLALSLLGLPTADDPVRQAPLARWRCDRLTAQLVTDVLRFELTTLQGQTTPLPKMRPPPELVFKRIRHGLRAIRPALDRMAMNGGGAAEGPADDQAGQISALVRADMSPAERRALDLSILPVYTAHDEFLFLRVLQAFETTFALLAIQLRGAVAALTASEVDQAVSLVTSSATALRETAPLFSMLATMQVESFQTFRQFTEGASAIQSRNYKLVESLCRQPDTERLDSPAYHSVPEVHSQVSAGQQVTLDDAYTRACGSGQLSGADQARLAEAMTDFSTALLRWRTTHHRLAVHMLGNATGTGYTEGTPYLAAGRDIPVFASTTRQPTTPHCS